MRTLIAVAAAAFVAVAIGTWWNSASCSTTDAAVAKATLEPSLPAGSKVVPTISIREMHNQARLENLPIQEIDDQTFVFSSAEPRH